MSSSRICLALLCFVVGETFGLTINPECGRSIGCFSKPSSCSGPNCDLLVTWKYNPTTKKTDFEVQGGSAWVAVGFNGNATMIGTKGLLCYKSNAKSGIRGFDLTAQPSPASDYVPLPAGVIHKGTVNFDNGKLSCSYSRDTTIAKQRKLDEEWYMVTAWGDMYNITTGAPGYHGKTSRIFTSKKVNITSQTYPSYHVPGSSPYHSISFGVIFASFFAILAQLLL